MLSKTLAPKGRRGLSKPNSSAGGGKKVNLQLIRRPPAGSLAGVWSRRIDLEWLATANGPNDTR
jgi:hypothetical protein